MNFIKLILYAALGVVLFYVGVLVYHTIWDWKPAQVLPVAISHPHPSDEDESLEFLIWNVGFGGLGAETSFFYDGGETVIPGNIIVRQRGTKFHPGTGVDIGVDHTIFAVQEGKVEFRQKAQGKMFVSVVA